MHGTLDYLLAAALIALPLAVEFHDDTATVLMLVLGGAATLLAIGTNWSTGVIRILPPLVHGVADIGATVVLVVHRSCSASATKWSRRCSTSRSVPADSAQRC